MPVDAVYAHMITTAFGSALASAKKITFCLRCFCGCNPPYCCWHLHSSATRCNTTMAQLSTSSKSPCWFACFVRSSWSADLPCSTLTCFEPARPLARSLVAYASVCPSRNSTGSPAAKLRLSCGGSTWRVPVQDADRRFCFSVILWRFGVQGSLHLSAIILNGFQVSFLIAF